MAPPPLRLGTRSSALARWQAEWVAAQLIDLGHDVELVPITTSGDADQRDTLFQTASPGVFTKELQRALLDGQIDLAVHSLKDLPTDLVPGLTLAAVPPREDPRDVLVSRSGPLGDLPTGAQVGTGSLRRRAQLLHARGDLQMRDVRGNLDTRLAKLAAGQYDALVLAHAGLNRLGLAHQITETFAPAVLMPAVGQGALGIETRTTDAATLRAVAALDDPTAHAAVLAERSLLAELRGGCLAPVGAWARLESPDVLRLDAVVLSVDGTRRLADGAAGPPSEAVGLGLSVARRLIAAGAEGLIADARAK
jgi:hydroxymethylbilane synthase